MIETDKPFKGLIEKIVESKDSHAKWLNTLSLMENTGARKISRYEHPITTDIIVLKHAAEEARHAYYLKKLIGKIDAALCPDYSKRNLLAPLESYHYLHKLDVETSRYIKDELKLTGRKMKEGAYLLVTYAIEMRADSLYPIYQEVLTAINSKVNVKSIILEEEGHLEEMTRMLKMFHPQWEQIAEDICNIEEELFNSWVSELIKDVST